jgi:hypothetical protein
VRCFRSLSSRPVFLLLRPFIILSRVLLVERPWNPHKQGRAFFNYLQKDSFCREIQLSGQRPDNCVRSAGTIAQGTESTEADRRAHDLNVGLNLCALLEPSTTKVVFVRLEVLK